MCKVLKPILFRTLPVIKKIQTISLALYDVFSSFLYDLKGCRYILILPLIKKRARHKAAPVILVFDMFLRNFRAKKLPVHPGNIDYGDFFRTFGFAGIRIGAVSKTELIHFGYHFLNTVFGFYFTLREQGKL